MLLFRILEQLDRIFIHSKTVEAAIIELVDAIAGITFFITPRVS